MTTTTQDILTVSKPAEKKPSKPKKPSSPNTAKGFIKKMEAIYDVDLNNWYKSLPYGFRFYSRKGESSTFFLPINPNNINITTHFATNVITTLYGTVEEHSEVRYHDIVISGTTGMAPMYSLPPTLNNKVGTANKGRESFPVYRSIGAGFASRTEGLLRSALGAAEGLIGFTGKKNKAGLDIKETGYWAFHNFFRFFLIYKKDAAGEGRSATNQRGEHPLVFLNYKDGTQYNAAITKFDFTKDASDPMLYKYKIVMRCYELKSLNKQTFTTVDLGESLGIGEVTSLSIFTSMKRLSRNAKNAAGAVIAAASAAGS